MESESITKKEVQEMKRRDAIEILMMGAVRHMKGAGCGPGHIIPTGEEAKKYAIAIAWAHKRVYGFDAPQGYGGVVYYD